MLFDAKSPKPPTGIRKYIPLPILVVLIVVIIGALYFKFRNYPEERAVNHFLTELESGSYQEAYRLWQPAPSYTYQDFLHDWGPNGDYGKVREFSVLRTKSRGSDAVVVTVQINNQTPTLDLVVSRKTKGLAYSPF